MLTIENFIGLATLVVSIAAAGLIWFQLLQSTNSAKAALLISINRDLNSYSDVATRIEQEQWDAWVENLSAIERERLLDYISYFEGIYLAYRRGLFSLTEINDYFSGRFFRLTHNRGVQSAILLNDETYGDIFRPIFVMHSVLVNFRYAQKMKNLYPDTDLRTANEQRYEDMNCK